MSEILEVVESKPEALEEKAGLIQYHAVGKRKTAVARVFLRPGPGIIRVNKRKFEQYFGTPPAYRQVVNTPFRVTRTEEQYNVFANVRGGGSSAQVQAIRHGIARALIQISPDHHTPLKRAGLLTRDPRMVERKKYGRKKARRGFQWTKR